MTAFLAVETSHLVLLSCVALVVQNAYTTRKVTTVKAKHFASYFRILPYERSAKYEKTRQESIPLYVIIICKRITKELEIPCVLPIFHTLHYHEIR